MRILVAQIFNRPFNQKRVGSQGFSILEILVALSLVAVVFTIIPNTLMETEREKLEESLSKINRAIGFATNEAILRNSIVRIKIDTDKSPVEYSIQYAQSSDLVLPRIKNTERLSLKEREFEEKKQEELNGQFANVSEFSDSNEPLSEGIKVYGLITTDMEKIQTEGSLFLYFYPTGERDHALIVFYSFEELATLKVSPFELRTDDEYLLFNQDELANLEYSLENKVKGIVDKWSKE